MNELLFTPVVELVEKIKNDEIKAENVVEFFLDRIKKYEPQIGAFVSVFEDSIEHAKEIDKKKKIKKTGKLTGIPIAIKDNICVMNKPTTCSSKILLNYIPPYDATVVKKLKSEDAIIIGKTNMDEFAMGSSTENSAIKLTKNPWDLERVPGGSSGGSAAAVAMRMSMVSLGSDTGGSIRQPASFCGVLGLKPTYGSVSRYGLVAFASSLDQIGPFSIYTKDLALILEIISGKDSLDSTSVDVVVPNYLSHLNHEIKNLKIGIPKEYFIEGLNSEVREIIENSIELLEYDNEIVEISLPHTKYAVATYYIIAPSEASSNLARYDGVKYGLRTKNISDEAQLLSMYKNTRKEGFGNEVKRRVMLGTYALSAGYYDAYYLKAQKVRRLIKQDFEDAFKKVDVIITPTSPTPPFKLNEKISDPLTMYLSDIFTIPANLAGLPAISIPCGFTKDNLPVSLQAISSPFDELTLLKIAYFFEQQLKLCSRIPQ